MSLRRKPSRIHPTDVPKKSGRPSRPLIQLRRQLFVHSWTGSAIGDVPQNQINRARDVLHLHVIDLLRVVARPVVVLVHAVKEETDRNAFACVIEIIAAEEEAIRVVGTVVAVIVCRFKYDLLTRSVIAPSSVLIIFDPIR
jgi:hypothetical protein